ncbi:MAG: hypothetical protein ACKO9Z_13260 [Planctomycetota bacterium]
MSYNNFRKARNGHRQVCQVWNFPGLCERANPTALPPWIATEIKHHEVIASSRGWRRGFGRIKTIKIRHLDRWRRFKAGMKPEITMIRIHQYRLDQVDAVAKQNVTSQFLRFNSKRHAGVAIPNDVSLNPQVLIGSNRKGNVGC